jgi:hypothetical protein
MSRAAEFEQVIAEIRACPSIREIRELVDGASEAELRFRPGPSEWSAVECLRHLGDVETLRHIRWDRMLAEPNPQLDRPALPPGERDGEDPRVLLARYERLVDRALERMDSWSDAEWRRVGTQLPDPQVNRTVPQPTDMAGQALRIIEHSGTHLRQMRDNLAAYRSQTR